MAARKKTVFCVFASLLLAASMSVVAETLVASTAVGGDFKYTIIGKPSGLAEVDIIFAIKQTNTEWLKSKLYEVSSPKSPHYGMYMNFDAIARYVHGRPQSVQLLEDVLRSVGIAKQQIRYTIGRDFAVVRMTISSAEKLFNTDYYTFTDQEDPKGKHYFKAPNYTIPHQLKEHLDFVFGVSELPTKPRIKPILRDTGDEGDVTPEFLYKEYNIGNAMGNSSRSSQAVASFLKQYFSPSDLRLFQKGYKLPLRNVSKIIGENDPGDEGAEANLDVQYIMAMGRKIETWFVSTSQVANHGQEGFLTWIIDQVNRTDSPLVHSASYGDIEDSIPADYKNRVEVEFQKFGVSGRTLFFASGDSGVDCRGLFDRKFTPMWPASSPSVTAVGGTVSLDQCWNDGGGGFSNFFPTPDYQKEAVSAFLASGQAPPTKYFNTSGRGYPDVSAFSVSCMIYIIGIPWPVDGTSCASPIFAGIISLLNDARLSEGKPPLGFLNPTLYEVWKGKGFFDITKGSNPGGLLCEGFKAITGWDPASGWGSPNFGDLKKDGLQLLDNFKQFS